MCSAPIDVDSAARGVCRRTDRYCKSRDFVNTEQNQLVNSPFVRIVSRIGRMLSLLRWSLLVTFHCRFLRQLGHDITIYEAMPKLGGMLRHGIPEYRSEEVLDEEIAVLEKWV